jgi:hypothetical protein
MKHKSILLAVLVGVFALNIQSVFADNYPITPAVTQCSITPKDLPSTGGQLTVQVHIVSLNGIYGGVTAVTDNVNKSGEHLFTGALARINGTAQDGDWQAKFLVTEKQTPGNYRLSLYPILDVQGINDGYIHCDSEIVNLGVPKLGATSNVSTSPAPSPAPTVTITAQPSPAPTVTITASPDPSFQDSIYILKAQVKLLQAQIKKICSAKARPKGC